MSVPLPIFTQNFCDEHGREDTQDTKTDSSIKICVEQLQNDDHDEGYFSEPADSFMVDLVTQPEVDELSHGSTNHKQAKSLDELEFDTPPQKVNKQRLSPTESLQSMFC